MEELLPNISNDALIFDGVNPSIRPNEDTEGNNFIVTIIYYLDSCLISLHCTLFFLEERDRIARAFECQSPHMQVYNKWYTN